MLTIAEYQKRSFETAAYPEKGQGTLRSLSYVFLGLGGEAGEAQEHAKRIIRDDNCVVTPERKVQLKKELGDVAWYLAGACTELGLSLEEVLQENLDKLQDRKKRGMIKGSGDDR